MFLLHRKELVTDGLMDFYGRTIFHASVQVDCFDTPTFHTQLTKPVGDGFVCNLTAFVANLTILAIFFQARSEDMSLCQ